MNEVLSINTDSACELTTTAAKLKDGIEFDEWKKIGASLAKASRSLQWWIGDWLNYGVKEYGDKRALAIEHADIFGTQPDTVRQCMMVAERVGTRVPSLSWTHHREVCGLAPKEQKSWLNKADKERWSVSQLRQAIRSDGAEVVHDDTSRLAEEFNPVEFSVRTIQWFNSQPPIAQWSPERREATKECLKPIVDMWEKL